MWMIAALLAVSLSLKSPGDYTYTKPFCGSEQIKGIGMGADGDYTMLRAEDVAFLREAYVERTSVPFAGVVDGTNAIDRLIPVRPHTLGAAVFDDASFGGCFRLSYTTNQMPYADITSPGSFVRDSFRFETSTQFEEVEDFPATDDVEFRMVSSNAVENGSVFTTNEIPSVWWKNPYVMTTNHIRSLYAALPLFDYAAVEANTESKTNRVTRYKLEKQAASVTEYNIGTSGYEVDGGTILTTYKSGYKTISSVTTNETYNDSEAWDARILGYRSVIMYNEYDVICDRASGPYRRAVLGNYKAEERKLEYTSADDCYVWVESPVEKKAQDDITILQTVLDVHLTYTVTRMRNWNNFDNGQGQTRTETTNIVKRAVMRLPWLVELDKSVGLNWNGTRWYYKMTVPMDYIYSRATSLFGDVDDYWPTPAKVEDDEIATTGMGGGAATGRTYVSVVMSFSGTRVYMVYRRDYAAQAL